MDLDRDSDMVVPKYNGCICLKLLQLRPGLLESNPETDSLTFKHKHTSVMDTVKQNAKMHLKSVVGSLSGFMSQLVSDKRPREPPSKAARAEINRLKRWSGTSVSSKVHEKLLKRLWKARVPNSSFKQKSSKWVDMGFQSSNPVSDFRGGGELALRSLVYVAEKYPKVMSSHSPSSYPLCVGGINLALMIAQMLRLSDEMIPETRYWTLFENPEAYFVVFATSLRLLQITWRRENGTLTEFSRIMSRVRERIQSTLDSAPDSLSSFERTVLNR